MNFLGKLLRKDHNNNRPDPKDHTAPLSPLSSSLSHSLSHSRSFESVYATVKVLGTGSFATVHLVERKSDRTRFAAKFVDRYRRRKRMDDKALMNEISILTKVRHRNLTGLVDFFDTEEHMILVMDLAKGGELFAQIEQRGTFTEMDAASIIRQLLEAVEYLHALGIAHRDLKPENILMKTPDHDSEVVITDFGLSRIVNEDDHFLHTTCGSPMYVAPEVLRKTKGYGRPVDLWSIGVITYILLCGYAPFWGEDQPELFNEILAGQYEFDEEHWSQISDTAKDFIRTLLDPNAETRVTAAIALKHGWLDVEHDLDILPTVKKNFSGKRSFKKAANAIRLMNRLKHAAEEHHPHADEHTVGSSVETIRVEFETALIH
ncbi:kinase-like domain-containing protein [Chytriomyces sp. MP71]|nr:kinase-like domain-containing protein [Chytriomyces sp. MP71]